MKNQMTCKLDCKPAYLIIIFILMILAGNHSRAESTFDDYELFEDHASEAESHNHAPDHDNDDPLESFNRIMFKIHQILDGLFFQPIAGIYDLIVHPYAKVHIHNALQNLHTPSIFINDCLQGNGENAQKSFIRFLLNSTMGVLGFYDFARDVADIESHQADFGQTMYVYGIKSGPYLFIPILGPTNFRDFIGAIIDSSTDPVNYTIRRYSKENVVYARTVIDAIDQRVRLQDTIRSINKSYDPYVSYKSLYTQNRAFNISNGEIDMDTDTSDSDDE